MNVFHYDPETGKYLGYSEADESPLEEGVFLIPAHTTIVTPPAQREGFARRFVNGTWGYSPVEAPVTPPTEEPIVTPQMVNAERDRRISSGFVYEGVLFDFDARAKANISGAAQLAFMAIIAGAQLGDLLWNGGQTPFAWIAADNTLVTMDAQTVVQFGRTAAQHEQAYIFAARALKDMTPTPLDYTNDNFWP